MKIEKMMISSHLVSVLLVLPLCISPGVSTEKLGIRGSDAKTETPTPPIIKYNGTELPPGQNLTAPVGTTDSIECIISRDGASSSPRLRWFIDTAEVNGRQTSVDHDGRWITTSTLTYTFRKESNGKFVKCEAANNSTKSVETTARLDIHFPAKVLSNSVQAALHKPFTFHFGAEGNPPPAYEWLHKSTTPEETVYRRGVESTLVISNVTYEHWGSYFCKVSNMVSGTEHTTTSDEIELSVVGLPQVLQKSDKTNEKVTVKQGADAVLSVLFCSNPPPSRGSWEFGALRLEDGFELGRLKADKIEKSRDCECCYMARLRINKTVSTDSKEYLLNLENTLGSDKYGVTLQVTD